MIDKLFKSILEVQSYSGKVERMTKLISGIAKSLGAVVTIDKGNVYVTKGKPLAEGYPCIVAHTDTVHEIVPDGQFKVSYDYTNRIVYGYNPVLKNFTGIGGDDKVGIYIALAAVQEFGSIKACFFRDEEIGCVGSGLANISFFSDCMYILQCDRRGNADFVTSISGTEISSSDFQNAVSGIIAQHGYKFAKGMTTDVGKLTQLDVGISCANMSCGYYNPHQPEEIIDVDDVNNTKDMVFKIISNVQNKYPFTAPKYTPTYTRGWDESFYEPTSYKIYGDNEFAGIEFPFDDELKDMTDAEIADFCMATHYGYEYIGNKTYMHYDEETGVPVYTNVNDMAFDEMWHMMDDDDIAFVFSQSEAIEQKRNYLKNQNSNQCRSCGSKKIGRDNIAYYDSMCYSCYNEKVYGW